MKTFANFFTYPTRIINRSEDKIRTKNRKANKVARKSRRKNRNK